MSEENKGYILKERRKSRGISLDMVHDATKIPMDVLKAIEEGYKVGTLTPFYYKGFVKLYAKYLEIDPADILGPPVSHMTGKPQRPVPPPAPKSETKAQPEPEIKPGSEPSAPDKDGSRNKSSEPPKKDNAPKNQPHQGAGGKPATGRMKDRPKITNPSLYDADKKPMLELGDYLNHVVTKKRKQQIVQVIGVLLALFIVVKVIGWIGGLLSGKKETTVTQPTERPTQADEQAQDTAPAARAEQPAAVQPDTEQVTTPQEDSEGADVRLTVRARKNSWLQVKADGSVVFQAILKAGVAETWEAEEKIEISGRNIHQLEMELNGKLLGTLGSGKHRVSKVEVTENGLSVKK